MRAALLPALSLLTMIAGCASNREPHYQIGRREPISLRDDGDACGASLVQSFVGLRANDALRSEVATRSGARTIRWIEPGSPVTMDYSESRLNGELDVDGVIQTLRCG